MSISLICSICLHNCEGTWTDDCPACGNRAPSFAHKEGFFNGEFMEYFDEGMYEKHVKPSPELVKYARRRQKSFAFASKKAHWFGNTPGKSHNQV